MLIQSKNWKERLHFQIEKDLIFNALRKPSGTAEKAYGHKKIMPLIHPLRSDRAILDFEEVYRQDNVHLTSFHVTPESIIIEWRKSFNPTTIPHLALSH